MRERLRIHFKSSPRRCPFCHGGWETSDSIVACVNCVAKLHSDCWEELGYCASCGYHECLTRRTEARSQSSKHPLIRHRPAPATEEGSSGPQRRCSHCRLMVSPVSHPIHSFSKVCPLCQSLLPANRLEQFVSLLSFAFLILWSGLFIIGLPLLIIYIIFL